MLRHQFEIIPSSNKHALLVKLVIFWRVSYYFVVFCVYFLAEKPEEVLNYCNACVYLLQFF